jgi:hypothetical protein
VPFSVYLNQSRPKERGISNLIGASKRTSTVGNGCNRKSVHDKVCSREEGTEGHIIAVGLDVADALDDWDILLVDVDDVPAKLECQQRLFQNKEERW